MSPPTRAGPRIVIVGGGAGGLPLAARLGDTLGRRGQAEITLVDRYATHLWKPLLHEVAAGRVDADVHGIDYLALAYWHHFRFRQGTVASLDRARHELTLDAVCDDEGVLMLPVRAIRYDTLVILRGQPQQRFQHPRGRRAQHRPRHAARRRAIPSPAARRLRARRRRRRRGTSPPGSTSSSSARVRPASSWPPRSATPPVRTRATAWTTSTRTRTSGRRSSKPPRASCRCCRKRSPWRPPGCCASSRSACAPASG